MKRSGSAVSISCSNSKLSPNDYHRLTAQYDGGMAYQDASLGELFKWLKERGIYDRALIIVTADHGEALGERGLL